MAFSLAFLLLICLGAFDDDDVTHVEGEVNPIRDFDIISDELRLKDIDLIEKELHKNEKNVLRPGADKKLILEQVIAINGPLIEHTMVMICLFVCRKS